MKRIVAAFIVVVVLIASYWAYKRYAGNARLRDGEVTVADVRDSDGNTVHATPSRSDTPGTINTVPIATNTNANTQSASLGQLQTQTSTSSAAGSGAPLTDSQTPNAPNGTAFAGSGQFQVYRQGNLTWRINTSDGTTCILFATNEEWRKPLVYNHGCPNS
ncbi:hypothetical protein [Terriglobus sp.]|uniref:hypothetical protein n=1 Tax=Terriglobus sp. TaxID=1889013 RepID=UPI003AFFF3C4